MSAQLQRRRRRRRIRRKKYGFTSGVQRASKPDVNARMLISLLGSSLMTTADDYDSDNDCADPPEVKLLQLSYSHISRQSLHTPLVFVRICLLSVML